MRPRTRRDNRLAAFGVLLATLIVAVFLPVAGSVLAQTQSPDAGAGATTSPQAGPTGPTPAAGPTATATPGTALPGATSITDTEYLQVPIDYDGRVAGDLTLKNWLRVRGPSGSVLQVSDPSALPGIEVLSGSQSPRVGDTLDYTVRLPGEAFEDLYYQGTVQSAGEGLYATAEGPKLLPISIDIAYYTGAPGAETRVASADFATQRGPAKIVFRVRNDTRQMQELRYNDVQTKRELTAVAPVWTPYVVKIGPIFFPDDQFDGIQTDGQVERVGNGTNVTWILNLAPPDYPAEQTAIAQFLIARPEIPEIRIAAQPQYPAAQADAITSEGIQFEKGRRSFLFDVFDLLRSNLVSLTGLFGLLDDAFANLALPLVAPERANRERGTFDDPNQLWALWTLAKGMEQLNRATDVLDYSIQLTRNGLKGEIGTLQQMRHLLGKSTDRSALDTAELLDELGALPPPPCLPLCTPAEIEAYLDGILTASPELANEVIGAVLAGSIWQNIKDLEAVMGCTDCLSDTQPFLPEAPISTTATNPVAGLVISVIRLKMSLFEYNLTGLQKENHQNQLATFSGITNTELSTLSNDWRKFTTITFPFGQEELADGLYNLKVNGVDQIQAALGTKDQPNSIIWAMHVLTDGMESLSDSFAQLGSTWRYLADSLQNFGIFGVETAKNTLQLDINQIDIESSQRAASVARVTNQATTFMGSPEGSKKVPVTTQFVLTFTTNVEGSGVEGSALATTRGKVLTGVAFGLVILTLLGFARFRWYLI